ncbi:hypothetical protein [Sodalis sp. RH19]|uniref:hypothetical protein n=1 Tax=unclassified Sodalis (in: enterobacteria) TaxID=2636512 RepID=UPI0039B4A278
MKANAAALTIVAGAESESSPVTTAMLSMQQWRRQGIKRRFIFDSDLPVILTICLKLAPDNHADNDSINERICSKHAR